jgi:hypothetical protein
MGHKDKPRVIADHEQKVLTHELHASIESDMRQALKAGRKATRTAAAFESYAVQARNRPGAAAAAGVGLFGGNILMHILDYNSVESTLLASSILTNLAGISEWTR